ncbi:hypothetical protein [Flavobacterium sp. 3HN19-14]|uniref:hypothetical protein n=1 Tax=Flavobacterium sp. 3HN19-14 TaxID=3448133 RepID=UPI003EE1E914
MNGINSKQKWDMNGNSGTDAAQNFIGTTDSQPLAVRTANAERIRIGTTGNIALGSV